MDKRTSSCEVFLRHIAECCIHTDLDYVSTYLPLIIAKKEFHIECELYILAQSIGLVLFEKDPINEIFKRKSNNKNV